jgi:hypothetical protein
VSDYRSFVYLKGTSSGSQETRQNITRQPNDQKVSQTQVLKVLVILRQDQWSIDSHSV